MTIASSLPPGALLNAGATVLVVEDDDDLRDTLASEFHDAGYRVRSARSGREALDALSPLHLPAIVLLDLGLPDMDGVEFLNVQSSYIRWAQVPVVVVSGSPERVPHGAPNIVGVVQKPVDPRTLLSLVRTLMHRSPSPS